MSEEKIDVKKLTISQAIDLFFDEKISKNELKEAFDKRSLFKLNSKKLENVLYAQRKNPSMFPKKLRIKSSDIIYEYGRTMSAGQLMNLASKGYVSEKDLLKALKKSKVMTVLAAVVEKENQDDKSKKEIKPEPKEAPQDDLVDDTKKSEDIVDLPNKQENESAENLLPENQAERDFVDEDILKKEDVARFFTAYRLLKMFFTKKMTREFKEAYEEAFKDNTQLTESKSKEMIKELKDIFKDNIQALFIIIMRLHFKGMILSKDVEEMIKAEFFREKIFEPCDEYDVLDKDGNVIYSYKKRIRIEEHLEPDDGTVLEVETEKLQDTIEDSREEETDEVDLDIVPETENYPILEPITREEVVEAYRDSTIDTELFKRIFTMSELIQMYRQRKISVKIFALFDENKRKNEILKAFEEGYIHLEEIMELFFYHDGISVKELKSIIKELPKRVAIVRFITAQTGFKKIFELYKHKLIDFNILCELRAQSYISEEEFEEIRTIIDKEEFYSDIESTIFYTRINKESKVEELPELESVSEVVPEERTSDFIVDISDGEKVLLTKVLGISEEEIQSISIIDSKDENGNPTSLDGYQIISDKADGLVIFGKFDYTSPIFVMGYEEAAYFLRIRDDEYDNYIYDDLMFAERLDNNSQICVVEHDENMGKNIVQALCELSEVARERYSEDEKYIAEVRDFIKEIDDKYLEIVKDTNTNM